MSRWLALIYGLAVYLFFLAAFLYAIAFVENVPGFKAIDSGAPGAGWPALAIDLVLLGLFAVQHSVMARQGFKRWWTGFVPQAVERTTYVLAASIFLALIIWQWRPLTAPVWQVEGAVARSVLLAVSAIGWAMVLATTFLINHFELFGLQQVYGYSRGRSFEAPSFKTPGLYRIVRHPLYLGFILAFWAAPRMTEGHLLFAAATTGYIFIGIFFEERDLVRSFGDSYRQYRANVPMLAPRLFTAHRVRRPSPQ